MRVDLAKLYYLTYCKLYCGGLVPSSFTAEEAWQTLNEDTESVHLLEWFDDWTDIGEISFSDKEWGKILEIRSEVNKHIEEARNQNIVGSSLEAELELFVTAI